MLTKKDCRLAERESLPIQVCKDGGVLCNQLPQSLAQPHANTAATLEGACLLVCLLVCALCSQCVALCQCKVCILHVVCPSCAVGGMIMSLNWPCTKTSKQHQVCYDCVPPLTSLVQRHVGVCQHSAGQM